MVVTIRPELGALPIRLQRLPLDPRGYPVPWFVHWENGVADFRVIAPEKIVRAVREGRCWICGERRGIWGTFCLGPMCVVTRTTSEPPCHHECATYAAKNCPFLVRPHMRRREDDYTASLEGNTAGIPITRNPGVVALWTTRGFEVFADHQRRPLFKVGDPGRAVEWYAEGRAATRDETLASIKSGLPALEDGCEMESTEAARAASHAELARLVEIAAQYLPALVLPDRAVTR